MEYAHISMSDLMIRVGQIQGGEGKRSFPSLYSEMESAPTFAKSWLILDRKLQGGDGAKKIENEFLKGEQWISGSNNDSRFNTVIFRPCERTTDHFPKSFFRRLSKSPR